MKPKQSSKRDNIKPPVLNDQECMYSALRVLKTDKNKFFIGKVLRFIAGGAHSVAVGTKYFKTQEDAALALEAKTYA